MSEADHAGAEDRDPRLSRRQVLGGGVLLSVAALAGCASSGRSGANASTTPNLDRFVQRRGAHAPVLDPATTIPVDPPRWGLPHGVNARANWTNTGVARPREIDPMGGIHRITIHHDGLPPTTLGSRRDVAGRIELIRRSHVDARGFADIGYHYIIDPSGRIWQARNARWQGAHAGGARNEHNLGILVLGNFEAQRPTRQALESLDEFVATQMLRYRVPIERVFTHRELKATICPGRALQAHMLKTRGRNGMLSRIVTDAGHPTLAAVS